MTLRWSGWVLLVFVDAMVSTPEVYHAWRPSDAASLPERMDGAIIEADTADELSAILSNHLEPAVFRVSPAVRHAHEELTRAGFGSIRVSGTGSTLYRLFDEKEAAYRAAGKIEELLISVRTTVVAAPVGPSSMISEEG